jgi:hypothetical protein
VTFDSTGLTPGEYTANLCVNSDDPVTPLVQVPVTLTVLPPFVLACNGDLADFETGIPPGWQVIDNEGFGVVWTDIAGSGELGNYTGAAGDAATASSDRYGPAEFDTELRSTSFDLNGWLPSDDIALNFLANYQNFAALDFLDLDISTDDGATWTNLLSWNEDHGGFRELPGEAVSIDLSPYGGMGGLKLRWHYYDPNYGDYDWYAQIDAVGLNCVPAPVIEVDPDSLSSTQEPGQVKTQILTISNLGRASLDWSIDEDITPAVPTRAPELDKGEPPSARDADADPAKLKQDNAVPPPYPRSAPEQMGYGRTLYVPRPDAILLDEGFEAGAIPPAGWTRLVNNPNETWDIYTDYPHSGANAAGVAYDPALIRQDEWLLSPEMPLLEGTLSFWSSGSLFWCRDVYDNCDLNVWLVVGDVGGGDDVFVGTADDAWSASYTWSQSVFTLTPLLPSGPVRIGFQYAGLDGDVIMLDDIVLDGTAEGPCVSPEDVPWLSVSPSSGTTPANGSAPIEVTTDATGLVPGLYEAKLCVNSTDPATPLVQVPVEMTVGPFATVVSKTANPIEVFEPGDNVEFTLVVANDRPVGATIGSLVDSDFDLAAHCPDAVGTVLAPNASYTCTFTEFIAGNVGEDHENFATASVSDDGGNSDEQSDSAQVAILDVLPAIWVVKAAPPYAQPGGAVAFTVTVNNDSVPTDPVTIGSMVDDVYGDITLVHDDIIATECATGVTIQSSESYICSFTATLPGHLVGEQTERVTVTGSHDEGNPTSAAGDATVAVLPPNSATDSSLCTFDRYPETGEGEFRLLFTPYFRNQPSYKLTASNPAQFYYNVFFIGEGPATVEVTLPYPYVTQGAMPVHVYGDFSAHVNETGQRCFTPEAEQGSYAARVALADHVDTNGDGKPDQATITVRDVPVVDGFGYMNIHLDYGLKAGEERYKKAENPDGTADAIEFGKGDIVIPDRTAYTFSAQVNGVPLDGDTIINVNEFKRVQGVAGFVWDEDADPIEGALVRLIIPEDVKFDLPYLDATTDEDGWYMIEYKHKGKPTDFPIQLWLDGNLVAEDMVGLKGGNAFVEKHFVVPAP